jgi:predicted lysophospholipase L1 biosynthesis ABC-type transport system permease subunit
MVCRNCGRRFASVLVNEVQERTDEIGIFRAIGFRKRHVMRIVFMEAAVVSGLAGMIGYFLGFGATKAAMAVFSASHPEIVPFSWGLAGAAFIIALAVGLISSAYPAYYKSFRRQAPGRQFQFKKNRNMVIRKKKNRLASQPNSDTSRWQPSYWMIVAAIFFFFSAGIAVKIV